MQREQLLKGLESMGLSDNEAKVYLACLSLGPSTILQISKTARIKRTSVYYVVEALKYKGLMNIQIHGFKKLFVVEEPERLLNIWEARRSQFKELLPEFSALHNLQGTESYIKYYEGVEAVKGVHDDLINNLKKGDNYVTVGNTEVWMSQDQKYFEEYIKRRQKTGASIRLLLRDNELGRKYKKFERNYGINVKLLPRESKLVSSYKVIPNRMLILQPTPPYVAITIENKQIIQMGYGLFEVIWRLV